MKYAEDLRADGYIVSSRWILGTHEVEDAINDVERERFAEEDVADLRSSNFLVTFSEHPTDVQDPGRARGGRHVEFGIALELRIPIFLIGPKENVFHWLPSIRRFDDWPTARNAIKDFEW